MTTSGALSPVYNPQFIMELAMDVIPETEVCRKYGVSVAEYTMVQHLVWFKEKLIECKKIVEEQGLSFSKKASLAADDALAVIVGLSNDPEVRPDVRLAAAKAVIEAAGKVPMRGAVKGDKTPAIQILIQQPKEQKIVDTAAVRVLNNRSRAMGMDVRGGDEVEEE